MSVTAAPNGRDLIRTLLELTGKEYCTNVKGVTVSAYCGDVVTVTVEMIAEQPKDKDAD